MMYKNLLEAFPPPEFLDIPYTGISISDDFIRCIRFSKKRNGLSLEKYIEKPIPLGLITSGIINDIAGLAGILKSLKEELDIKYARVSLPEEKAYLFTTTIPLVSKKEVKSTIEFKIEENVPLLASEVVFDYTITNPVDYKDELEVVVSALPIKIVDTYVESVRQAGISMLSLEMKSQAIARAILPKANKDTFIIAHFNVDKVGLYVVDKNEVHFTSTVMLESSNQDNSEFLSNEIGKLEVYWSNLKENKEENAGHVDQIIVCGESISDSMVPYLSAHHKIPVSLGNVWTNIFDLSNYVPPIQFIDSLKYAPAIGLAIPTDILI